MGGIALTGHLKEQIAFIVEIDKLKTVLRRNLLLDGSRPENDAEHTWHMAFCAVLFHEYAAEKDKVDLLRVLKMILIHDLIEIYVGDTFAYDEAANIGKTEREREAAIKMYQKLPDGQGEDFLALWEEFEAMNTPDSRYAAAMDRMQAFIGNAHMDGHTWRMGSVNRAQVYKRMDMVRIGAPALWGYVEHTVEEHIKKGNIRL